MDSKAFRETVAQFGAYVLKDEAIVSTLIGNDRLAARFMESVGHRLGSIGKMTLSELNREVGNQRASARIFAALELARRVNGAREPSRQIRAAYDVYEHCRRYAAMENEIFVAIGVNCRNRVTWEGTLATGWESGVNMTPKQVYTPLVKECVGRAIFVHNHPSGDPTPSPEDMRFTKRLLDAAQTLDIKILDHVIVAQDGFVSIRDMRHADHIFG